MADGGYCGPALGGLCYDRFGAKATYFVVAALFAVGLTVLSQLKSAPPEQHHGEKRAESLWTSIAVGVRFVFGTPVLVGSMALDLFAVLFGGAIALLPVFAKDILHVGASGLGMMNAAPSVGALTATLLAARFPPLKNAGRNLLFAVGAFGVAIIVFAVSRNLYVTLVALFLTGVFDGINMVIRKAIVRLLSPPEMRGRIAAVSMIFIGSSNEVGAMESGIAAHYLGTVRSVWAGGVMTLLIVAATAGLSPQLRNLRLTGGAGTKPADDK